jgi:hypothetical protein
MSYPFDEKGTDAEIIKIAAFNPVANVPLRNWKMQ